MSLLAFGPGGSEGGGPGSGGSGVAGARMHGAAVGPRVSLADLQSRWSLLVGGGGSGGPAAGPTARLATPRVRGGGGGSSGSLGRGSPSPLPSPLPFPPSAPPRDASPPMLPSGAAAALELVAAMALDDSGDWSSDHESSREFE